MRTISKSTIVIRVESKDILSYFILKYRLLGLFIMYLALYLLMQ